MLIAKADYDEHKSLCSKYGVSGGPGYGGGAGGYGGGV